MTPEERKEIIRKLDLGVELSPEWERVIFLPEKREYEFALPLLSLLLPIGSVHLFDRRHIDFFPASISAIVRSWVFGYSLPQVFDSKNPAVTASSFIGPVGSCIEIRTPIAAFSRYTTP